MSIVKKVLIFIVPFLILLSLLLFFISSKESADTFVREDLNNIVKLNREDSESWWKRHVEPEFFAIKKVDVKTIRVYKISLERNWLLDWKIENEKFKDYSLFLYPYYNNIDYLHEKYLVFVEQELENKNIAFDNFDKSYLSDNSDGVIQDSSGENKITTFLDKETSEKTVKLNGSELPQLKNSNNLYFRSLDGEGYIYFSKYENIPEDEVMETSAIYHDTIYRYSINSGAIEEVYDLNDLNIGFRYDLVVIDNYIYASLYDGRILEINLDDKKSEFLDSKYDYSNFLDYDNEYIYFVTQNLDIIKFEKPS